MRCEGDHAPACDRTEARIDVWSPSTSRQAAMTVPAPSESTRGADADAPVGEMCPGCSSPPAACGKATSAVAARLTRRAIRVCRRIVSIWQLIFPPARSWFKGRARCSIDRRAEPGPARATAPAPPCRHAGEGHGRAPRRAPGAGDHAAVHRALVAARGFDPNGSRRLLEERRSGIWLMRGTIHLATVRDALAFKPLTQVGVNGSTAVITAVGWAAPTSRRWGGGAGAAGRGAARWARARSTPRRAGDRR